MAKKVGGGLRVRASDDELILEELAKIADGGPMAGISRLRRQGISFERSEIGSRVLDLLDHCTYSPPKKRGPKPKPQTLVRANRLAQLDEAVRGLCAAGIPRIQAVERVSQNSEFTEDVIWNACNNHGSKAVRAAIKQRRAAARRT